MSGFTVPTKLIDYLFIISVSVDSEASDDEAGHPFETVNCYYSYPPIPEGKEDALKNITPFCFPSRISNWAEPLYHDFVLTDERGQKRYATCVRSTNFDVISKPSPRDTKSSLHQIVNCICLISNEPRYNTLRACLTELVHLLLSSTGSSSPEYFAWRLMHEVVIPPTGPVCTQIVLPHVDPINIHSPYEKPFLPSLDFAISTLFRSLGISHTVDLFGMLLLEKSVLLHSKSLTRLTRCAEGFLSLLYPLQWDMVYVPIVPEVLKAPTPFLMGGESKWVISLPFGEAVERDAGQQRLPSTAEEDEESRSGVFIKDHDELVTEFPEIRADAKRLPNRQRVIEELRCILQPDLDRLDGNFSIVVSVEQFNQVEINPLEKELALRKVFLTWFIESFRRFRAFYRADGRFDERQWLNEKNEEDKGFYAAFAKTSMFHNFIITRGPDGSNNCVMDIFDALVNGDVKMDEILIRTESEQCQAITMKVLFDDSSERQSAHLKTFSIENFLHFQREENGFVSTIAKLDEMIEDNPSCKELYWMRAYCYEKLARVFGADEKASFDLGKTKCSLHNYAKVLESILSETRTSGKAIDGIYESLLGKIKILVTKIPKETIEEWLKTQCVVVEHAVRRVISPAKVSTSAGSAPKTEFRLQQSATEASPLHRSASYEPSDRLILNCNPLMSSHAHIDSNDSLDEEISELELSPSLRGLIYKPVELSVKIAELFVSMFILLSRSTNDTETMKNGAAKTSWKSGRDAFDDLGSGMNSMGDLRSFHPFLDFFSKNGSSNVDYDGKIPETQFTLSDPNSFKKIKKMPTFEAFKRMIVALRHVKLEEKVNTEEDKICFWLNVRLHILVEFGPPMNYQHRMTFTYHKPVYNIAGNLFSLNEITFGILKASLPLPTYFCPKASIKPLLPSNANGNSSNTSPSTKHTIKGSEIAKIHVQITSATGQSTVEDVSISRPTNDQPLLSVSGLDTKASTSRIPCVISQHATETVPTSPANSPRFIMAKIPLKFIPTDLRYRYRITTAHAIINFALVDGTRSSPRMNVYRPGALWMQLNHEAIAYIDKQVEFGKTVQLSPNAAPLSESLGFSLLGGGWSKKRMFLVPQWLLWHVRDFVGAEGDVEELMIYILYRFPSSKLAKFLRDEDLVTSNGTSFFSRKTISLKPIEDELKLHTRIAQTHMDPQRCLIRGKDHQWEVEVKIAQPSFEPCFDDIGLQ